MLRMRSYFTAGITLLACLSVVLVGCGSSSTAGPSASPPATAGYKHIFYIMMENHATNEIIGNTADAPYINQLASQYGVAMSYYGVTHPSLPNYLAAISGNFQGIWDDCKADASFVWISPDQCNDMHGLVPANATAASVNIPDCATPASGLDHKVIALGDKFLSTTVPTIMNSPAWKDNSAIVVAWDEDDYAGDTGCCKSPTGVGGVTLVGANAPAIIITSKGPNHIVVSDTSYNHYSLLGTIEKLWGLGCLANTCGFSDAQLMTRFFD